MSEVSIDQVLSHLALQTKNLIIKTEELIKTKIANFNFIGTSSLAYAKEAALKWSKWDIEECEDIFDMNEQCSDILCDFHHAFRIALYQCEYHLLLQENDTLKDYISKCKDCLSCIDSILDEYSFSV